MPTTGRGSVNRGNSVHEMAAFGRRVAAAQGLVDERPAREWVAYGQACYDALARRRPLPLLLPPSAPPPPPPYNAQHGSHVQSWLPPGPPGTDLSSPPTQPRSHRADIRRRSFLGTVAWGLMWRYAILGALLIAAAADAQKPWLAIVGVLVTGQALGMWRRRSAVARVWRTLVVAGTAVYVAPLFSFYPTVLIGSISTLTIAPVLHGIRRHR